MKKIYNKINIAAALTLSMSMIFATSAFSKGTDNQGFSSKDMFVPLPKNKIPMVTSTPTNTPIPTLSPQQIFYNDLTKAIETVEITYTDIEYEYIGTYYITAYCPAECGGSWMTASGETCHRSDYNDRMYEPTTCAIDRKLHNFGDLFYVEGFDRVFVAEDTGSAVKGKHLDLFYEEYSDVCSFPTGYYTVYSVKYVEKTLNKGE